MSYRVALLIVAASMLGFAGAARAESVTVTKAVQDACAWEYDKFCNQYGLGSELLDICFKQNARNMTKACVEALIVLGAGSQAGRAAEHARDDECERQAGDVTLALDRVDALARDADGVGELLLGPSEPGAELLHAVADGRRRVKHACHDGAGGAACQACLSFARPRQEQGTRPAGAQMPSYFEYPRSFQ